MTEEQIESEDLPPTVQDEEKSLAIKAPMAWRASQIQVAASGPWKVLLSDQKTTIGEHEVDKWNFPAGVAEEEKFQAWNELEAYRFSLCSEKQQTASSSEFASRREARAHQLATKTCAFSGSGKGGAAPSLEEVREEFPANSSGQPNNTWGKGPTKGPLVIDQVEFHYFTSQGQVVWALQIENNQFTPYVGQEEKNRAWDALQNFYTAQGTQTSPEGFAVGNDPGVSLGSGSGAYGADWGFSKQFDWDGWKVDRADATMGDLPHQSFVIHSGAVTPAATAGGTLPLSSSPATNSSSSVPVTACKPVPLAPRISPTAQDGIDVALSFLGDKTKKGLAKS